MLCWFNSPFNLAGSNFKASVQVLSRVIEPSSFVRSGVSHIGGKLPRQLRELCVDLTSMEREEELTYRAWREGGKSHRALIQSLCLKKHCSGVASNYFIFFWLFVNH